MIDLFAGTGAFTHAFQSTGQVECVFANDALGDPPAPPRRPRRTPSVIRLPPQGGQGGHGGMVQKDL